jgi:hypothetical protein
MIAAAAVCIALAIIIFFVSGDQKRSARTNVWRIPALLTLLLSGAVLLTVGSGHDESGLLKMDLWLFGFLAAVVITVYDRLKIRKK